MHTRLGSPTEEGNPSSPPSSRLLTPGWPCKTIPTILYLVSTPNRRRIEGLTPQCSIALHSDPSAPRAAAGTSSRLTMDRIAYFSSTAPISKHATGTGTHGAEARLFPLSSVPWSYIPGSPAGVLNAQNTNHDVGLAKCSVACALTNSYGASSHVTTSGMGFNCHPENPAS
ncbi:hypothetical protein V502_03766 [Pseudogymnoascus sp. VKM F-4520 (FW-2644)]|nr:hypothetical protein V502_03766 [Pseudogymnoascus sp. VKM F-4520 (FW-2644)]